MVVSIYFWSSGDIEGGLAFLAEAFIIGLIFWFVFPREYQAIRITNRTSLTVNFVTRITRNYVEIVKKKGLNIAITPADNDSFVVNANQALEHWLKI
jgi:hypothetical protein